MSDIVFDRMLFDYLEKKNDQSNVIARLSAEVERLRLTDDEKEAIEITIDYLNRTGCRNTQVQTTLRGLLKRLGGSHE
jgi:hypothetical protein